MLSHLITHLILRHNAETLESREGKLPFGVVAALGSEIAQLSQVFILLRKRELLVRHRGQGRFGLSNST